MNLCRSRWIIAAYLLLGYCTTLLAKDPIALPERRMLPVADVQWEAESFWGARTLRVATARYRR